MIKWAKKKIKKLDLVDYSILKTALIVLGIIIGAYIAGIVKQYVWYFVGVFVMLYTTLLIRMFKK